MLRGRYLGERTLISIGEASQILGVSEAALRQWTDNGRIRAFITPGHQHYHRPNYIGTPKLLESALD